MALTIKCSCRLYLQFTGINIPINKAFAAKLQKFFGPDTAGNFANNICVVTKNIAFYHTAAANYNFCTAVYIANDGTINAQIGIAADIAFYRGAGAD